MPIPHPYITRNEREDLWFKQKTEDGGWNCYFFSAGWVAEFPQLEEEELFGYCPSHTTANATIDLLYVPPEFLDRLEETTREEALRLHPRLAAHLRQLDEDP